MHGVRCEAKPAEATVQKGVNGDSRIPFAFFNAKNKNNQIKNTVACTKKMFGKIFNANFIVVA